MDSRDDSYDSYCNKKKVFQKKKTRKKAHTKTLDEAIVTKNILQESLKIKKAIKILYLFDEISQRPVY